MTDTPNHTDELIKLFEKSGAKLSMNGTTINDLLNWRDAAVLAELEALINPMWNALPNANGLEQRIKDRLAKYKETS